jgi:hypothetical protein
MSARYTPATLAHWRTANVPMFPRGVSKSAKNGFFESLDERIFKLVLIIFTYYFILLSIRKEFPPMYSQCSARQKPKSNIGGTLE